MSKKITIKVAKRDLCVIEAELHTALKSQAANKIRIGELLAEAKGTVTHGEWLPWLENNSALSERSAQHYMAAAEFAAKYENFADFKLPLSAIYVLRTYDDETVAAVLKVAKTRWLNKEGVERIAEEFQRSKHAKYQAVGQEAAKRAEEQADTIPSEQEAEERAEAEPLLDAPPEPPPPAAPAVLPHDEFLTSTFQRAVEMLKGIMTRPAAKFVRANNSAADLELAANFLNQVAIAKAACGVTTTQMGDGGQVRIG